LEDLVPTEFYLSQNYPDPFKERTIIKYCLPEEIRIKLEILNSEKEKIKTLVDEVKEPGMYQVEWNAKGLNSNNYYFRIQAGSFIDTKKMILLK
jgi:hypothetical protein